MSEPQASEPDGIAREAPPGVSVVPLRDYWYVACLASELRDRPLARTIFDTPMALFRDERGWPAAVLDRCPHRNAPLSLGTVREGQLQCGYHGWRFDGSGQCRAVPGLPDEAGAERRSRQVDTFPTAERDGFVWVFPGLEATAGPSIAPFRFPPVDSSYATVRRSFRVDATLHAALENTLDVPHTAFLHGGLFRGRREPVDIEVIVRDGPDWVEAEYVGEPRPEGLAGRILAPRGGVVSHVDRFVMPSIAQVEYRLDDNHLVVTSAFTPVGDFETRLHTAVSVRLPVPTPLLKAVLTPIANRIFAQDAMILRRQAETIRRFGGEHFASTELDVLGGHIGRMLRRAEKGEQPGSASASTARETRIRMRV